jgi:hypothetical protein
VNIHYEDANYHTEECEEGRALGFVGKVSVGSVRDVELHAESILASHPPAADCRHQCGIPADQLWFVQASIHFLWGDSYPTEIYRAAKILYEMNNSHKEGAGAIGLALKVDGKLRKEMIDAPMVKQVRA